MKLEQLVTHGGARHVMCTGQASFASRFLCLVFLIGLTAFIVQQTDPPCLWGKLFTSVIQNQEAAQEARQQKPADEKEEEEYQQQQIQQLDAIRRICWRNKTLPNMYVLGAQKAGSTQLSYVLEKSHVVRAARAAPLPERASHGLREKEWHLFNTILLRLRKEHLVHDDDIEWNFEEVAKRFFELLPDCHSDVWIHKDYNGRQKVVRLGSKVRIADMTPENLAFTDPGYWADTKQPVHVPNFIKKERGGWGVYNTSVRLINLPATLWYLYGDPFGSARFVALLREPLSRMQSEFYMKKGNHFKVFTSELKFVLKQWAKRVVEFTLWRGLYGRQLQDWFKHFFFSQFAVVPYKYMQQVDKICPALSRHFDMPLECESFVGQMNGRQHPSLKEEVPRELLARAQKNLAKEQQLLESVLLDAHSNGANLPAFELGKGRNASRLDEQLRAWLLKGW